MAGRLNRRRAFRQPLVILLASLAGLVWALLAEGPPDAVASLLVAVPLLAILWAWVRRRRLPRMDRGAPRGL